MAKLFSFFIALFLTTLLYAQKVKEIDVKAFESGIQADNSQLIDARTPGEYEEGHLKGAKLMDWKDQKKFSKASKELDKSKPVYVYCLVGARSYDAAEWLSKQGFSSVYSLKGGIKEWQSEGKPVVKP